MRVAVIDIETIPDSSMWSKPEPADRTKCEKCSQPLTEEESAAKSRKCPSMKRGAPCRLPKEKKETSDFAPLHAHQIVCIGMLAMDDGKAIGLGAMTATTKEAEAFVLRQLNEYLSGPIDLIVTWNGASFDLPVVQLRSFHHGIPQPWYKRDHRVRYAEDPHIDVKDALANHVPFAREGFHLDAMAKMIGLPGKNGTDGSMVQAMVESGRINDVAAYCLQDVVQTAAVYLRYRLMRGNIAPEAYRESIASLVAEARKHDGMRAEEFRIDMAALEAI